MATATSTTASHADAEEEREEDFDQLHSLLKELEGIDIGGTGAGSGSGTGQQETQEQNLRQFSNWRPSFLSRYNEFLEDPQGAQGVERADEFHSSFQRSSVKQLIVLLKRLRSHLEKNELDTKRCTVRARQTISNLQYIISNVTIALRKLLPTTLEEERDCGYSKFQMGALLIREGFTEYGRLTLAMEIFMHLKTNAAILFHVDRQFLQELESFDKAFKVFLGILADLGLQDMSSAEQEESAPVSPPKSPSKWSRSNSRVAATPETPTLDSPPKSPSKWSRSNSRVAATAPPETPILVSPSKSPSKFKSLSKSLVAATAPPEPLTHIFVLSSDDEDDESTVASNDDSAAASTDIDRNHIIIMVKRRKNRKDKDKGNNDGGKSEKKNKKKKDKLKMDKDKKKKKKNSEEGCIVQSGGEEEEIGGNIEETMGETGDHQQAKGESAVPTILEACTLAQSAKNIASRFEKQQQPEPPMTPCRTSSKETVALRPPPPNTPTIISECFTPSQSAKNIASWFEKQQQQPEPPMTPCRSNNKGMVALRPPPPMTSPIIPECYTSSQSAKDIAFRFEKQQQPEPPMTTNSKDAVALRPLTPTIVSETYALAHQVPQANETTWSKKVDESEEASKALSLYDLEEFSLDDDDSAEVVRSAKQPKSMRPPLSKKVDKPEASLKNATMFESEEPTENQDSDEAPPLPDNSQAEQPKSMKRASNEKADNPEDSPLETVLCQLKSQAQESSDSESSDSESSDSESSESESLESESSESESSESESSESESSESEPSESESSKSEPSSEMAVWQKPGGQASEELETSYPTPYRNKEAMMRPNKVVPTELERAKSTSQSPTSREMTSEGVESPKEQQSTSSSPPVDSETVPTKENVHRQKHGTTESESEPQPYLDEVDRGSEAESKPGNNFCSILAVPKPDSSATDKDSSEIEPKEEPATPTNKPKKCKSNRKKKVLKKVGKIKNKPEGDAKKVNKEESEEPLEKDKLRPSQAKDIGSEVGDDDSVEEARPKQEASRTKEPKYTRQASNKKVDNPEERTSKNMAPDDDEQMENYKTLNQVPRENETTWNKKVAEPQEVSKTLSLDDLEEPLLHDEDSVEAVTSTKQPQSMRQPFNKKDDKPEDSLKNVKMVESNEPTEKQGDHDSDEEAPSMPEASRAKAPKSVKQASNKKAENPEEFPLEMILGQLQPQGQESSESESSESESSSEIVLWQKPGGQASEDSGTSYPTPYRIKKAVRRPNNNDPEQYPKVDTAKEKVLPPKLERTKSTSQSPTQQPAIPTNKPKKCKSKPKKRALQKVGKIKNKPEGDAKKVNMAESEEPPEKDKFWPSQENGSGSEVGDDDSVEEAWPKQAASRTKEPKSKTQASNKKVDNPEERTSKNMASDDDEQMENHKTLNQVPQENETTWNKKVAEPQEAWKTQSLDDSEEPSFHDDDYVQEGLSAKQPQSMRQPFNKKVDKPEDSLKNVEMVESDEPTEKQCNHDSDEEAPPMQASRVKEPESDAASESPPKKRPLKKKNDEPEVLEDEPMEKKKAMPAMKKASLPANPPPPTSGDLRTQEESDPATTAVRALYWHECGNEVVCYAQDEKSLRALFARFAGEEVASKTDFTQCAGMKVVFLQDLEKEVQLHIPPSVTETQEFSALHQ